MKRRINHILDTLSEFFAHRKGLLLIVGIFFIILNFFIQFYPGLGWVANTNLFMHVGLIIALFGVLLAWAL